ncbi:unnamed protein product [Discula destructiva]
MAPTKSPSTSEELQKKTYKEQLDEAAIKAKLAESDKSQGGIVDTVIEKGTDLDLQCATLLDIVGTDMKPSGVSHYIPAVGQALGHGHKKDGTASTQPEPQVSGPPERPHHDVQIEEFVRDQHGSRIADNTKSTDK